MSATRKKHFIHFLAVYGCVSAGIMYLVIGIFAILSHYEIVDRGADESSMLAVLNNSVIGYIMVCVILLGTLSFICWRIYEAIKDPYEVGRDARGIIKRVGIGLSTLPDVLIVYSAVTALFGTSTANEDGRPTALHESVTEVLDHSGGNVLMVVLGSIILISALIQFAYGSTTGYKERLAIDDLGLWKRRIIHFLGITGYYARGVILTIIAYSFIRSGYEDAAHYSANTDKAFEMIARFTGSLGLITIALATIFYAVFMFVSGVYYDTD
jgi:hypothetical protein